LPGQLAYIQQQGRFMMAVEVITEQQDIRYRGNSCSCFHPSGMGPRLVRKVTSSTAVQRAQISISAALQISDKHLY
jgi:hypothetical protein